jgi:hypothetical protein
MVNKQKQNKYLLQKYNINISYQYKQVFSNFSSKIGLLEIFSLSDILDIDH